MSSNLLPSERHRTCYPSNAVERCCYLLSTIRMLSKVAATIRTLPLPCSPNVLYVLQYPLRPRWRPFEFEGRCDEVRVKPSTVEVEIDLNVDIESNNYDSKPDCTFHMKKHIVSGLT
ncbi:DNA-directed RNA polymerase III subunit RPC5 isoform X2 [Cucumis melo var. makuwa]|uniref:DNA-directed RNA polymerase III subunit RPC5 isoform X2 n=1 Tax=Cucumis melo var. makuwa TaxID=1194695 RepID=A0A5A7SMZ5_CUCMM|nr:DNA-directed RNA polymerase III subunit RPC5 isoform X2 [Cucumis melo var. makuwa]